MKINKLKLLPTAIYSFVIALWSDSQCMEGYYTISNCELGGKLSYTDAESCSGRYAQVLPGENYNSKKEFYEPGGRWRNRVLWYVSCAENGYYTISNCELGGKLSYTDAESCSGRYAQVLSVSNYNSKKEFYGPGGRWRNRVLWHISPAEDGYYTISNCELGGKLSYTDVKLCSGYCIQALSGPNYNIRKGLFGHGGAWRNSVLWNFVKA